MQQITDTILISTKQMMERTGRSRSTLVRWANKKIPGAYYNNYSQSWEWDYDEFVAGIKRNGAIPHPRARRGRRGRFEVVK